MKKNTSPTVVITGGTKGIGEAITRTFHEAGYNVVIGSRKESPFVRGLKSKAWFVACDVTRLKGHEKLIECALKETGRVDVYINCAGASGWKPLSKITEEFLEGMLAVNLKGSFYGCQAAAKVMKEGASIINISSLAGKRGSANNSVYCMAKFGVTGLTQSLAKELGAKGIRVNAVCPVYVETPGLLQALKDKNSPAAGGNVASYLKQFAGTQSALKRLPLAQEIATACLFLASPHSSAITGQSINVDCGVLPQ